MNPLKRLGCRMYQGAFRFALPLLPYREPELLHTVGEAHAAIRGQGLSRPLIITGKGIVSLGLDAGLRQALSARAATA